MLQNYDRHQPSHQGFVVAVSLSLSISVTFDMERGVTTALSLNNSLAPHKFWQ